MTDDIKKKRVITIILIILICLNIGFIWGKLAAVG